MGKVIARLFGGMGNQLFIYSAARRLALVSGRELVLDDRSGFAEDKVYRRNCQLQHFMVAGRSATAAERFEPFGKLRRYLNRRLESRRPFDLRRYIVQEGVDFDARLLTLRPKGDCYLEGYWQSEDYFKDVEPIIRQDLTIKLPTDPVNQRVARDIESSSCPVAVHLRFFEPAAQGSTQHAPPDYYRRALAMLAAKSPQADFFVFSDRPDLAQESGLFPAQCTTFVSHNLGDEWAYADLWLMTLCRHHIIANSTFSWWGAWLASQPDKIIVAPGFERRSGVAWWGFAGLIPASWVTC